MAAKSVTYRFDGATAFFGDDRRGGMQFDGSVGEQLTCAINDTLALRNGKLFERCAARDKLFVALDEAVDRPTAKSQAVHAVLVDEP